MFLTKWKGVMGRVCEQCVMHGVRYSAVLREPIICQLG